MHVTDSPSSECKSGPRIQGLSERGNQDDTAPQVSGKIRRLLDSPPTPGGLCESSPEELGGQLPSPSSHPNHPVVAKRKAAHPESPPPAKRARSLSQSAQVPAKLQWWLSNLPSLEDFDDRGIHDAANIMSWPTSKRSRSSDSSQSLLQSPNLSDATLSIEKKYSVYQDANYPVVLETKGSFMRASAAGMFDEDKKLCQRLLTKSQPLVADPLFSDDHFEQFLANLRGRSEARIYLDLHPRLAPSVENLYLCGREKFAGLVEGHNDPWVKSVPFYGPRPQPDHTYGFKWSNFTAQQRHKLRIEPTEKSYYTAREDIYFPFLTAEVKCGKSALDLADRPNLHSMTIQMRGIVDLYRRINRPGDVHRRVLGFSISHDERAERIHAYYPEIDGDKTTYWQETLKTFFFDSDQGKDKWTSYHFTLNVCEEFALPLVQRLKEIIDQLPDPPSQPSDLPATPIDFNLQGSQDGPSIVASADGPFKKPRNVRGQNMELRNMMQTLQQSADRQQQEAKERERVLQVQLEQQRVQQEQQRNASDQQLNQLLAMLKDQSEEIKAQRAQLEQLLPKPRST